MNKTPFTPVARGVTVSEKTEDGKLIVLIEGGDDFDAWYTAEAWCRHHTISYGSMQRDNPIGMLHGEGHYISKWSNMTRAEQLQCDGTINPVGRFRTGPVRIILKKAPA